MSGFRTLLRALKIHQLILTRLFPDGVKSLISGQTDYRDLIWNLNGQVMVFDDLCIAGDLSFLRQLPSSKTG
jgi:hypothetical protein